MHKGEASIPQRIREGVAFGVAGLGLSSAAAFGVANHLTETTTVGTHEGTMTLTLDGHATARNIPVLGSDLRVPSDAPARLGVRFDITNTPDLQSALQRDALIAAQPAGEKENMKEVVIDLVRTSAMGGIAIGVIGTGGIYLRRRYGVSRPGELGTVLATAGILTSIGLLVVPGSLTKPTDTDWAPLAEQVPVLAQLNSSFVNTLEISNGDLEDGAAQLINSGVAAYETSNAFYGPLKEKAALLGPLLHQPTEGQEVAVIISDRHDNSNMDPVVKAAADAAGATIVLDAGDDLGSSQPWEMFSLNSLFATFKDYKHKYVATGNHDWASFVPKAFKDAGWTVLSGDAVPFLDEAKIVGERDPRRSSLGDLPAQPGDKTIPEISAELSTIACEDDVAVALVHSPGAAKAIAETGCVPLVIAGHQHWLKQELVQGINGDSQLFINGTTGGSPSLLPIALWQRLHNDATIGFATFEDDRAVGIQSVTFKKSGEILVGEYTDIPLPSLLSARPSAQKP